MKSVSWLLPMALIAACAPGYENPDEGKPVEQGHVRLSMEQVDPSHARSDAAEARSRGDRHLLGVYRYSGEVPGAVDPSRPVLFIEDTSDHIRGVGHARFNKQAAAYALAYNQELQRRPN